MEENIRALLVQARTNSLDALRLRLEQLSINVITAQNCAEAALALWSYSPPHLVFTEIQLADGNWADVLTLAAKASAAVNVIVVAPFADVVFYVQAIERGAFDFIVPPLSDPELRHVVRIAADHALIRRRKHAAVSAASLIGTPHPEDPGSARASAASPLRR
jgi:DNA-binding NtrC family response regulator